MRAKIDQGKAEFVSAQEKLRKVSPALAKAFEPWERVIREGHAPTAQKPIIEWAPGEEFEVEDSERSSPGDRADRQETRSAASSKQGVSRWQRPMMRGQGRVFKRKHSAHWWLSYYVRGREIRESSGSPDRKVAERLLKHRRKEIGADQLGLKPFVGPAQERITVAELLQDLETDYQVWGRKSLPELRGHLKAVRAAFGDWRAVDVTPPRIRQVIAQWQAEGRTNATINRRLAAFQRAYAIALEAGKLSTAPRFPSLKEDNARQGFWERGEFLALLAHTPDPDLRDFYEWAYWTGMRKGESAALTWAALDRETWTLRLHAKDAKTGKGRVLALEGPLRALIERRIKARRLDCPVIFHRGGHPIREFRKSWASACEAAGLTGKLFHDLRRTGVRNLVRAGVPQSVAMAISGHRTASVFRRYDITSEQDLRDAVKKVMAYVESLPTTPTVTSIAKAAEAGLR